MLHWRKMAGPEADRDVMRCVVDDQGQLVFVTPALRWALGQRAADLVHTPLSKILNVVTATGHYQASTELAALASGFYEVALLRQGRDPLLISARIDLVRSPDNKKLTVIWLDPDNKLRRQKPFDISQEAREFAVFINENLQKEEQSADNDRPDLGQISKDDAELKHFTSLTKDMLGICRTDGTFVKVNPSFNRVLGYSDTELQARAFIDLVHADERADLAAKIFSSADDINGGSDFECRMCCKDGQFRSVEWTHKAVGPYVYIVGRDITHIKHHEAELHRREAQLSEAQKIGRMGHWYWGMRDSSMEWSDQIYTMFGVDKANFIPHIDSINKLVLKSDAGVIYKTFKRAQRRKKDYDIEFRLRRPGGGVRYIRCEGRCKVDPETGEVEALYGIMQDITERTLHEKALRAAKEAAESAYASKTRFLANMSHELRTPLNAIIGFSEMIQRQLLGPVGNARYLEYIGGIRDSGEHLLDLINDILDMSKIEIGKYELHVEELNVGKVIRLAVHMVEGRAHEAQVRIVTDAVADDIQIVADRRALMQVLLNLMSNAVKFTRGGGVVQVSCQREPGGVMMTVADTGIGIPKDKIDVVTLPFEQVDSEFTRRHEGSGLGLAITKELIELHGGTMAIDSEVGIGTTVTVLLPEQAVSAKPVRREPVNADMAEEARGSKFLAR